MKTPIFGPAYISRSRNLADNHCINLYPEIVETKQGKEIGALYGCPGLTFLITCGTGPIRALHVFASTASLFVVSGTRLYEVVNFTTPATFRGNIGNPGTAWNYSPVTHLVTQITLPFTTVTSSLTQNVTIVDNGFTVGIFVGISAAEQDGFVVINSPTDSKIWQSALLDLTTFDPLNFGSATGHSDNVVAVAQIHRQMFIIEQVNTEVWSNVGTPGFTFGRIEGVHIEAGCIAPGSVVQVGETLMWLGQNLEGSGVVIRLEGYVPRIVSTAYTTREFQSYSRMDDAVAYTYQQEGHEFYIISSPSWDATWGYDVTASAQAGIPMWHRRASFSGGQFHRHPVGLGVYFGGVDPGEMRLLPPMNVVGDCVNGNLYSYNLAAFTDNGAQRKWLRSWRAMPQSTKQPVRFSSLMVDMQTGIGIPDGTSPVVVLRQSDDGGHNWSGEMYYSLQVGATAQRVKFNRLGSTRRNSGLDRIFELSSTDQFPVAILGADTDV